MTTRQDSVHIDTPLTPDTPEIPYDPAKKGPGVLRLVIDFNREEVDRLSARQPRGPLIRFIKQAALEAADQQAQSETSDNLPAAD